MANFKNETMIIDSQMEMLNTYHLIFKMQQAEIERLKRPTGNWIDEHKCSECGYVFGETDYKFCPICGAEMG